MTLELLLFAVILLGAIALFDIAVGVSNDAANFLNSSIGSRVAPRRVILIVASLGLLAGVVFSSGMMEVARKGIFNPHLFTMPELIMLFLAVMVADIIILDLFNGFGLPTSTTVSIVFELLGAAVAISILKIMQNGGGLAELSNYINSAKALLIIIGILLSVAVAFTLGAIAQILTRLLFTFEYESRLRRYGAIWGGVALSSITYFILVKGAKGASFLTPDMVMWIQGHTWGILLGICAVSAVLLQILQMTGASILRPIVLIGTFALAMAFAANDLVNFIGVPMAGYHAFTIAKASSDPLGGTMDALSGKVAPEPYLLLLAGGVMVVTLWFSRKARTVSETEINLANQDERDERFEPFFLSRGIVRMMVSFFEVAQRLTPPPLRAKLAQRMAAVERTAAEEQDRPPYDLLRATVNLMVASAIISYATSRKLPLSTTYVTFMVAMGTSFADLAWGRESAVYRVTGVLTVIGGWFMTAVAAFFGAGLFAIVLFYTGGYGLIGLMSIAAFAIWRNHGLHSDRVESAHEEEVLNLKKVTDVRETVTATFEQMGHLLQEIRQSLDAAIVGLFEEDLVALRKQRKASRKVQRWTNIITANIFKALRLLQSESADASTRYAQTARRLQKLADGHRDIVMRAALHVSHRHTGFLGDQASELDEVRKALDAILLRVENAFKSKAAASSDEVVQLDAALRELAQELNDRQIARIRTVESKTRLSILYYAIIGNARMISKQCLRLLDSFDEAFGESPKAPDFDLD
jgi:phosphate/sulfate permease